MARPDIGCAWRQYTLRPWLPCRRNEDRGWPGRGRGCRTCSSPVLDRVLGVKGYAGAAPSRLGNANPRSAFRPTDEFAARRPPTAAGRKAWTDWCPRTRPSTCACCSFGTQCRPDPVGPARGEVMVKAPRRAPAAGRLFGWKFPWAILGLRLPADADLVAVSLKRLFLNE